MTNEQLQNELDEIKSLEVQHNLTKHNLYNKRKLHPQYMNSLRATITRYYNNMERLKEVLREKENK
jgi:hypothetical protein